MLTACAVDIFALQLLNIMGWNHISRDIEAWLRPCFFVSLLVLSPSQTGMWCWEGGIKDMDREKDHGIFCVSGSHGPFCLL